MKESYNPVKKVITLRLTPQELFVIRQRDRFLTTKRGKHRFSLSYSTHLQEFPTGRRYSTPYVEAEVSGTGKNNYDINLLKEGENELRTRGILSTRVNGHCLVIKVTQ